MSQDEQKVTMRIQVQGHEEGDLLVMDLHGRSGALRDGVTVRFEKKEGWFVLNPIDLEDVITARKDCDQNGQSRHQCNFPDDPTSTVEEFTCTECGVVWWYNDESRIWEYVGFRDPVQFEYCASSEYQRGYEAGLEAALGSCRETEIVSDSTKMANVAYNQACRDCGAAIRALPRKG